MLKSVQLLNFRGFRDHTVEFSQFSLLIGQNNAGKTTLIEALRLIGLSIRRGPTATFQMSPEWLQSHITGAIFRFSVDTIGIDHKTIHYNYRSDEPAMIRARFTNNSIVVIAIGPEEGDFYCQLLLPGGKKINSRAQVNSRRFPSINVMPPVGSLLDRETHRDPAYMRKHIDGYLSHRHLRNQMSSDPESFDRFRQKLEQTWGHLQVGSPEFGLGEKKDEWSVTIRDGPFVSEMGLVGSGLQAWIQTLWFLSRAAPDTTIVLDEPDVYLHADLQRKLIKVLTDSEFRQIIVATHSIEMITSVSANEIISVTKRDSRSRALTSSSQAQEIAEHLGTSHNIQLSKLAQGGHVLFLEGKDHSFLDQFAFKLGNANYDKFSKIPHFAIGGMSNWKRATMAAHAFFQASGERVRSTLIIDRDYKTDEELDSIVAEAEKSHLHIFVWSRKEIENYLMCRSTLSNLLITKSDGRIDHFMTNLMFDTALHSLTAELTELVADSIQASDRKTSLPTAMRSARAYLEARRNEGATDIDLVSGKQFLSRLSAASNENFGVSFGAMTICRLMKNDKIPNDILDLFKHLACLD